MHRSLLPRHVFSVRSQLRHISSIPMVQIHCVVQTTQIQKLIHSSVLKHVFSVRCADTHSLNQPPTQYHSAPVYITKTHFYDWNTKAFLVCLLLTPCYWPLFAAIGCIAVIVRFLLLSEQYSCLIDSSHTTNAKGYNFSMMLN